jgi:hypothetical protein
MTPRQRLITNYIKLLKKEVFDFTLSSHRIQPRLDSIARLKAKLERPKETKKAFEENTFFGKRITYPCGTRHTINNSWNE